MGKKKNKKSQQAGGRGSPPGGEQGGDALAGCRTDDFIREQERLLEQFSATAAGDSVSASKEAVIDDQRRMLEASEAVVKRQRELLEEAATDAGKGGGGGGGGGLEASQDSEAFAVRRLEFYGREVPMLLQNRNGPCALLAVANALLLRGTLTLEAGEDSLSSGQLIQRLASLCEKLNAKAAREDANVREAVSQVVQRLPALLDGLLVNCRFAGCADFEYTAELGLFDLFGLELYHVWVAPEVAEAASSWNALAERLAGYHELRARLEAEGREPETDEDETLAQGLWLEMWLEETRAQATPRGLQEVAEAAQDRGVAVLFRNNHFCTIFKPRPQALCVLLTDEAFRDLKSAVWESLEVDGSVGRILNASFEPAKPEELDGSQPESGGRATRDSTKADLVRTVQEMGFSREHAEAGLAAVDWSSVEEAVEALLEADGGLPEAASTASAGGPAETPLEPVCPRCGKRLNTRAGLLSHRVAKGH